MLEVIHGAVGSILGQYAASPAIAFGVGFASHFVLDMIPHGDRDEQYRWRRLGRADRHYWIMLVDFFLTVMFVATAIPLGAFANPVTAGWGFVGAVLPDFFIGVGEITRLVGKKGKIFFRRFFNFHFWFHNFFYRWNIDFSTRGGIIFQGLIVLLLIIAIY